MGSESAISILGSIRWAAPEYLTIERVSERSEKGDVFSFGVIVWELATQEMPWDGSGLSNDDIRESVVKGKRLKIPLNCNLQLKQIMEMCWKDSNIKNYDNNL